MPRVIPGVTAAVRLDDRFFAVLREPIADRRRHDGSSVWRETGRDRPIERVDHRGIEPRRHWNAHTRTIVVKDLLGVSCAAGAGVSRPFFARTRPEPS